MRILALVVCLVIGGVARADTRGWSLALPAGWTDITADAVKEPAMVAMKRNFTDKGGTFEATMYSNDAGQAILVATVDVPSVPSTQADLTGFERAARERTSQGGSEAAYREVRTATTVDTTQRIAGKQMPALNRRITGIRQGGGLHSISIVCYGDPAVCDPLVAAATVDTTSLRALESLDEGGGLPMGVRIGIFGGSVVVVLLLIASVWRRRKG